jgi:hypothetical protein
MMACRPVQDGNPQEGAAEKPQIGHQRGGGVGGDGANADGLWCEDKAKTHEGHVDRGDAEQDTEFHGKSFLDEPASRATYYGCRSTAAR